jgi:hypothetical protein
MRQVTGRCACSGGNILRGSTLWFEVVDTSTTSLSRTVERSSVAASMLTLKSFPTAVITLAGVELAHRIRKGQFSFGSDSPTEFLSLRHLWNRGLEQPGDVANSKRRRNATRPPMRQNSFGSVIGLLPVGATADESFRVKSALEDTKLYFTAPCGGMRRIGLRVSGNAIGIAAVVNAERLFVGFINLNPRHVRRSSDEPVAHTFPL